MSKNRDFFLFSTSVKNVTEEVFFSISIFSLNLTFQARFHPGDNL